MSESRPEPDGDERTNKHHRARRRLLKSLACGGVAAAYALKSHAPDQLRSGRGGDGGLRSRLRPALLAVQVAVSLALLVGAGLFLRSTAKLDALRYGMDQDRVLVVTTPLRHAGYSAAARYTAEGPGAGH